jgi:hypothetical protein
VVSPCCTSLLFLLLDAVVAAATIGVGGVAFSFPFSFFASLFNLPFAYCLFFSLFITSLHGIGQHSSWYSFGTSGRYLDQSSTCLISLSPGFVTYSGVGCSMRMEAHCLSVSPCFLMPSSSVLAPSTLLLLNDGKSKVGGAIKHLPLLYCQHLCLVDPIEVLIPIFEYLSINHDRDC